jgi:hypothetical protein
MRAPSVGEIVRDGIAFNRRVAMSDDEIRPAVSALFDELDAKGIAYLLVGGVALLSYVEGRNTQDIALVLSPADPDRVSWEVTSRDGDFARADYRGVRVDLLLTSNAVSALVEHDFAGPGMFGERRVRCATRAGLVLLKLYALPSLYRQNQFARAALYETDILMLHQGEAVDDEGILATLAAHVSSTDLAELRRILDEQRSRRRFGRNG